MKRYLSESFDAKELTDLIKNQSQQIEKIIESQYKVIQRKLDRYSKSHKLSSRVIEDLVFTKNDLENLIKEIEKENIF